MVLFRPVPYKSPIGQLKSVKQVVTVHEIRLFIVLFKGQSHKIRCKLQYCTVYSLRINSLVTYDYIEPFMFLNFTLILNNI